MDPGKDGGRWCVVLNPSLQDKRALWKSLWYLARWGFGYLIVKKLVRERLGCLIMDGYGSLSTRGYLADSLVSSQVGSGVFQSEG